LNVPVAQYLFEPAAWVPIGRRRLCLSYVDKPVGQAFWNTVELIGEGLPWLDAEYLPEKTLLEPIVGVVENLDATRMTPFANEGAVAE
jgi:hypothetical protein